MYPQTRELNRGWVLRVVGLSGGLGLITGVKKNFKKNTPGCSPP